MHRLYRQCQVIFSLWEKLTEWKPVEIKFSADDINQLFPLGKTNRMETLIE